MLFGKDFIFLQTVVFQLSFVVSLTCTVTAIMGNESGSFIYTKLN